jgi:type II secretory pathway pseudopilin PulG
MTIPGLRALSGRLASRGFTLPEGLFGIAIMGTVFVTLYTGMTTGFDSIRRSRENLRATQILLEKFETIRLYNWTQVNTPGFIPTNFIAYFDPGKAFSNTNGLALGVDKPAGAVYTGVVTIANAPISEIYSNDLRVITVQLTWTSNGRVNRRSLSSHIARYGLQNYVY